jgi:hypothetical protein
MRCWLRGVAPALAVLALGSACGDPAVNAGFEGQPLATLDGVVCGGEVKLMPRIPRVGVLWKKDIEKTSRPSAQSTPIELLSPIRFRLDLFDAPPSEMLSAYKASDRTVQAEIGFAILFDDVDGDRVYSSEGGDVLLGVAWDKVILYCASESQGIASSDPMAPYTFTNPDALKPGFQMAEGICDASGNPIAASDASSALHLLDRRASAHIYMLEKPGVIPADGPAGSCVRFF